MKDCKFKNGEKVRVISKKQALKNREINPCFVEEMDKYCSKIVTIYDISNERFNSFYNRFDIRIFEDNGEFIWSEKFFKHINNLALMKIE